MIINEFGKTFDLDAIAPLMDDDIREDIASQGIDSEQEFFNAYCQRHAAKFGEEFEAAKQAPPGLTLVTAPAPLGAGMRARRTNQETAP